MFQKNVRALGQELKRRQAMGQKRTPRQDNRINELRNQQSQQLSPQELRFLDQVSELELQDLEMRRALNEAEELRGFKKQMAQGQQVSDSSRFEELIGAENRARNEKTRQKIGRNVMIGTAGTGLAAAGIGAAGIAAASANGGLGIMFPFSSGLTGGDDSALAAQQFRIQKELEEREFQNTLAQRTSVAQTDLDNDLMTMQQKQMFQQNLQNSLQQQQANALTEGGGGVDIVEKINTIAATYIQQGVEAPKAFSLAQQAVSMDGRANQYL